MVKIVDKTPRDNFGKIDANQWLEMQSRYYFGPRFEQLKAHLELARLLGSELPTDFNENAFEIGVRMAAVLAELNADVDALCAALLFQIVFHGSHGDTQGAYKISREELLKKSNKSVVNIVYGALELKVSTALSGLFKKKDLAQMDRLRKMFLSMVNDARVVLVKLAERVIAMRFSKHWDKTRREALAHSVFHIYAPLANRLGIGQLKWELEDRAFLVINPEAYQKITAALDEKRVAREAYMANLIQEMKEALQVLGISGEVEGRVKHIYSIYRKMTQKNLSFDQLFDIRAIRILVKDVRSCYEVLGYLHENFEPILSEFTDYIAQPKPNGYRSIHTVIQGPEDKTIEAQIRTFAMHEESEMGVAAHWRYKEGVSHDAGYEERIKWLRSLLDWQDELENPEPVEGDFTDQPLSQPLNQALDQSSSKASSELVAKAKVKALPKILHESLRDQHIYVFTPEGDVIDLETGSTPVDFAYRVHTDVGHRCRGSKVNGRIVPLTYELRTGDRVEILTGKESKPSRDWLRQEAGFVKSHTARHKIGAWFRHQEQKLEQKLEQKAEQKAEQKIDLKNSEVGLAVSGLSKNNKTAQGDLIIEGEDNLLFKMAGCCRPILGDLVGGYITQGRGISIHREDCKSFLYLNQTHAERVVTVQWGENTKASYLVELHIEAMDRPGLLKDLTNVLLGEKLSIVSMRSFIDANQIAKIALAFMVKEKGQVGRVTHCLMQVPKVLEVRR